MYSNSKHNTGQALPSDLPRETVSPKMAPITQPQKKNKKKKNQRRNKLKRIRRLRRHLPHALKIWRAEDKEKPISLALWRKMVAGAVEWIVDWVHSTAREGRTLDPESKVGVWEFVETAAAAEEEDPEKRMGHGLLLCEHAKGVELARSAFSHTRKSLNIDES